MKVRGGSVKSSYKNYLLTLILKKIKHFQKLVRYVFRLINFHFLMIFGIKGLQGLF